MTTVYKHKKHVCLYKVYGSLNYFFHRDAVIENNAWMWYPPDYAERVMITPGLSKYQTLQKYRQELLQSADAAIDRATHFLFLGYGFNDSHLEEYIKRKLIAQACNGLIITRDSNPRIESLLKEANNLWLVCKLADKGSNGSRIYNKQYSDWLMLPHKNIWDIREFMKQCVVLLAAIRRLEGVREDDAVPRSCVIFADLQAYFSPSPSPSPKYSPAWTTTISSSIDRRAHV